MTSTPIPPPRISADERTRLENLHGELLHEAASDIGIHEASVARWRAAEIAKTLGWVA